VRRETVEVMVRAEKVREGQPPPLVMLIPKEENTPPHVEELRQYAAKNYRALSSGVTSKDFLIVLQPPEQERA